MNPGYMVENIAGLKAIDMAYLDGTTDGLLLFPKDKDVWYCYDPNDTTTANDEWSVAPDPGKGTGRWHPTAPIVGTLNPFGSMDIMYPVTYHQNDTGSPPHLILRVLLHPGGGNHLWREVGTGSYN